MHDIISENFPVVCLLLAVTIIGGGLFIYQTYEFTDGFKISIQDGINKSFQEWFTQQDKIQQCMDDCVHNGGIFETCKPRCIR